MWSSRPAICPLAAAMTSLLWLTLSPSVSGVSRTFRPCRCPYRQTAEGTAPEGPVFAVSVNKMRPKAGSRGRLLSAVTPPGRRMARPGVPVAPYGCQVLQDALCVVSTLGVGIRVVVTLVVVTHVVVTHVVVTHVVVTHVLIGT